VNFTRAAVALLQTNRANEEREDLSGLRMWEVKRYEIEKSEKVEGLRRTLQLKRDLESFKVTYLQYQKVKATPLDYLKQL
jgi:hypothetical protein